ncbi:MAG: DUF3221 domain-containing protein [Candidatus Eisenbacteria bacterium]
MMPTEAPSIWGVVTAIGPERTLVIEENPAVQAGSPKAHVRVPNDVAIWDRGSGARRSFEDLRQGGTVSAWFTGPVAESYPVQATARAIVIESAVPRDSTVTVNPKGVGPIRVGMTVTEAERALGLALPLLGPKMEPCSYVSSKDRPGVAFMIIEGRVARVDIHQHSIVRTAEGAGIGDTEARIHSLYQGRVEVQPHKYVDGRYLIVRPAVLADSGYRVIFETDGRQVTRYRSGRLPEVRWIEGCS